MSSRFLGTQNASGITDGTLNIKGITLAGDNLVVGKPVRTNAAKQIISTDLLISDVQGLQAALNNPSFVNVTLSGDIIPQTNNVSDVGQAAKKFKNGYFTSITPTTINGPVSITGGDLDMQIRKITNVATPTLSADATTKTYVDTAVNGKLSLTGGTLTGQLQCQDIIPSTTSVSALGTSLRKFADVRSVNATLDTTSMTFGSITTAPAAGTDIANKTYVDTQRDTRLALSGGTMTGNITTLRTNDSIIILGSGAGVASGTGTVCIGPSSSAAGQDSVSIGNTATASGGSCVALGNRAIASGLGGTAVGIDSNAVTGVALGRGAQAANSASIVINANGGTTLASNASNQLRIAAGTTTLDYDATGMNITNTTVSTSTTTGSLRCAGGCGVVGALNVGGTLTGVKGVFTSDVTGKASWMESWWAHNAMQSTAMTTNTATTSLRLNTATSFYFSPSLAIAGINSLIPVVVNNTPVFASNGPAFPTEWVQSLTAITANAAGPSTTGGNRVQYTYSGAAARRFTVTVTGTYQTTTANQLIAFQGIVKFASAVFTFVNGTASSWFETDANRTFIAVTKKILLVNPGDVLEIAVGYDPLNAPNQLNSIIARDMTVTFTAMLNST